MGTIHSLPLLHARKLVQPKPFKESFLPRGVKDKEEEVERYNQPLADHPVGLQILGNWVAMDISGFNEPGTPFESNASSRILTSLLSKPMLALTRLKTSQPKPSMGIKTSLDAKSIILFAYGESKAEAKLEQCPVQ